MQNDIDAPPPLSTQTPDTRPSAAEKVRTFPQTPGVYLMKDDKGNVIYVGKAKNLRSRAGSYFLKEAAVNIRTHELVKHIRDIDFITTETEVDALLKENRLIKDIRPRFNKDLKDGKSYPYLQIRVREEFPRVEITRTPRRKGVRLYGPFTSVKSLKAAVNVLQRVLQFPHLYAADQVERGPAGGGSGRACSRASGSVPPRATSASAATSTAGRSKSSSSSSKARRASSCGGWNAT